MSLSPRLDLRQSQTLIMTPQLQQAIKLLQMSNQELSEFVATEIEQNPLLERADQPGEGTAAERIVPTEAENFAAPAGQQHRRKRPAMPNPRPFRRRPKPRREAMTMSGPAMATAARKASALLITTHSSKTNSRPRRMSPKAPACASISWARSRSIFRNRPTA